jgi:hypothetical protein
MQQTKSRKYKKQSMRRFCFLATTVMLIEIVAFSFLNKPYGMTIATGIHLSLMIGLYLWIRHSYKKRGGRFQMLLLIMTSATGPFGAAVCLMTAVGYSFFSGIAMHPNEWITKFFAEQEMQENIPLSERIELGMENLSEASDVEPFADILNCGTMANKQTVIAKITRHFRPQFAATLLRAAQDNNPAIRVHAAAALAKIERHFMAQYMGLEKALKNIPNHDKSRLQLAQVYEDYAQAGLIDEHSIYTLRIKAINIYEAYLAFNDYPEIKLRLARLYLHQNQAEKALSLLGETIATEKITPHILILLYMESLFCLRKFSEIRLVAKHYGHDFSITDNHNNHSEFEGALCSWLPAIENINIIKPVLEKSYAT